MPARVVRFVAPDDKGVLDAKVQFFYEKQAALGKKMKKEGLQSDLLVVFRSSQ